MVFQPTRSFTYILLFVAFALETWSSRLPNTSLSIESAVISSTLSITTGSSNEYDIWCAPPLSSRGPFLDRGECRQAVTTFYQRFPFRISTGQYFVYTLTHSTLSSALYPIKCPYVIAYPKCVFTLDYIRVSGGDQPYFHSNVAELGGIKVARSCVGKAPQEMIDGGDVTWRYPGTIARITLAHTAVPFEGTNGNLTSVGNNSAALVSSAATNLTFTTDKHVSVDVPDSE